MNVLTRIISNKKFPEPPEPPPPPPPSPKLKNLHVHDAEKGIKRRREKRKKIG